MGILRFAANCARRTQRTLKAISGIKSVANSDSYYPDKDRKNKFFRVMDNFKWALKYQETNDFYNLYGMDIVGADIDGYNDYYSFMITRNKLNNAFHPCSETVLLRDKMLFFKYMKMHNMPVPDVFAVIKNGLLYDPYFNLIDWEAIKTHNDYFIKDIDGECASFVKHISTYEELVDLRPVLSNGTYILQEKIEQLPYMASINRNSINTVRVITIYNNGEPYVFGTFFRVGTEKTGNVDNWAVGGLLTGINEDGSLTEYACYKPGYGGKTSIHPESKIVFSDFVIPEYKEALKLSCEAHKLFGSIHSIGWDVAITSEGPVFIEGNDNWEISPVQAVTGPLKNEWEIATTK